MAQPELDDLYGDKILEHCRNPRNHDKLPDPDASVHAVNPFCGDESDIQFALDGRRVAGVGAQAVGCSINQATTSMLAQAALIPFAKLLIGGLERSRHCPGQ